MPMIIGITGGIGSGKSTLAAIIRDAGFKVFDTDEIARKMQDSDEKIINDTIALLGPDVYKNGKLDRALVASIVFNDAEKLKALTAIIHPAVRNEIVEWAKQYNPEELIFIESAVLFEGGFYRLMDKIILVTAPEEIRIQRVMKRDGVKREHVLARIKNQIPEDDKIPESDLIINTEQGFPKNVLELIIMLKD